MPLSPNYKRRDSAVSAAFRKRLRISENMNKRERRRCCVKSSCSRRFLPFASMVALVVTWSGLFLFCWKMYFGLLDMETITGGLFKMAAHYLRIAREVIVILGVGMAALTGAMLIIGFCSTLNCELSYHGRFCACFCNVLGGNRILCGFFWFIVYLFNVCWLAILSALVLMTSAYFCFLPICLPQAGRIDHLCFNFTLIASAIGGGSMDASAVSLILCGGPIDKFCKLTKAIVPWYWGAYAGCLVVIIGLSHFNACLAANFAHVKHAARYRQIRRRSKGKVKWSKDWRIKSILITDQAEKTRVSTVSGSVAEKIKGRPTRRGESDIDTSESDSSITGYEGEPYFDVSERQRMTRGISRPRTTSTGSIVLQKRPTTTDSNIYNMADTLPYQCGSGYGRVLP